VSADARSRRSAAVIVVGTELTTGLRIDTNGPEVARALEHAGFSVDVTAALPDEVLVLARFLGDVLPSHKLVVVTGGLGPTHDDITREAAAHALGRPLVHDPAIAETLGAAIARHAEAEAAPRVLRQADVIEGAAVLAPTIGTAPGQVLEHADGTLVLLPGPPAEMRPMLSAFLEHAGASAATRILRTVGLPESDVQLRVDRVLDGAAGIGFTVLASPGLTDVVLRDVGAGEMVLSDIAEKVAVALGSACYSADGSTLAEAVIALAAASGLSIATAESCTGGGVAAALTDVPGASAVFRGGAVTYADDVKTALLGVEPDVLASHGAVSAETATSMATGARERFAADIAIAVTGIAGPSGGSPSKPVGTVWFAVAAPGGVTTLLRTLSGDRNGVRTRATVMALELIRQAIASRARHESGAD
jgi:nicotinamide-nucleotide amidase